MKKMNASILFLITAILFGINSILNFNRGNKLLGAIFLCVAILFVVYSIIQGLINKKLK